MPRTRQSILAATLLQPERSWYAADLARHLGTSRSSLQRELVALVKVGILKNRREGRMVYVQADRECPVFVELRGLLSKTAGLVDLLRDALTPFIDRIEFSFVFGSVARAQETSVSDIDLFIIGEVGLREVAPALQEAQKLTGREVNPKLLRLPELAKRVAARDHFVLNVLDKPKLFIVGSQHELDDVTKRESHGGGAVEQS
ncbi:MAG TPA: nucleotidyltransferase domain-containing protein [Humisphaera sp.]|nr:nucleotidyltransferase domain-containing protein [Humisphaera sp.]